MKELIKDFTINCLLFRSNSVLDIGSGIAMYISVLINIYLWT